MSTPRPASHAVFLWLAPADLATLQALAAARKTTPAALARTWIIERLKIEAATAMATTRPV